MWSKRVPYPSRCESLRILLIETCAVTLQDRNPLFREGEGRYVMTLLMLIETLVRTGLGVKWS